MTNPYRTTDPVPPSCMAGKHRSVNERVLCGGEGPDDAAKQLECTDCGTHGWEYCDGAVRWYPRWEK